MIIRHIRYNCRNNQHNRNKIENMEMHLSVRINTVQDKGANSNQQGRKIFSAPSVRSTILKTVSYIPHITNRPKFSKAQKFKYIKNETRTKEHVGEFYIFSNKK